MPVNNIRRLIILLAFLSLIGLLVVEAFSFTSILTAIIVDILSLIINEIWNSYKKDKYKKEKQNLLILYPFKKLNIPELKEIKDHKTITKIKKYFKKHNRLEENEKYQDALEYLKKALEAKSDIELVYSFSSILVTEGECDKAIENINKISPKNEREKIQKLTFLTRCYVNKSEFKKALNHLKEIEKIIKNDDYSLIFNKIEQLDYLYLDNNVDEATTLLKEVSHIFKEEKFVSLHFYLLRTLIDRCLSVKNHLSTIQLLSYSNRLLENSNITELNEIGLASLVAIIDIKRIYINFLIENKEIYDMLLENGIKEEDIQSLKEKNQEQTSDINGKIISHVKEYIKEMTIKKLNSINP
ncbi:hypothetical protein LPTSP3_g31280 [Leptospira kobayashii]|uniref:Tetratricopeptide repeat protein n=1 Tax=Leptospira kobayashii TaxID=1917830 RepID=A0ABN6KG98_9LEPT|nr:hypothetical protein [Leptospira kobayashii]BDA80198.1 hypothetical protein LPTSP3_g31280 [Leptospira kobayashii]